MSLITEGKKIAFISNPPTYADFRAIRHFHISHNAPYFPPPPPPKKKNCITFFFLFSFLLGITAVPRDIENNACKKFGGGGANKLPDSRLHLPSF